MGCIRYLNIGSGCVNKNTDYHLIRVFKYLNTPSFKPILVLLLLLNLTAVISLAQPYSGTIFIDPDIITLSDSSSFQSITYTGQGLRMVYDRRTGWITMNAYLFNVSWNDGLICEAQVNPEFGSVDAAAAEAEKYAKITGLLPTCLREDVDYLWIHAGTEPFGGGNKSILIHTGQAAVYEEDGILEETLVHEASHTSLDAYHATAAEWIIAQGLDPNFISTYAKENPEREDIAESFLPWLAVRYRSDRISEADYNTIIQTIPNRLSYFDNMGFDMYPVSVITSTMHPGDYLSGNEEIHVYPNPTGDILHIDSENPGPFDVRIWSANGNCIGFYKLEGNEQIELRGVPEGLYLLEIRINSKIITKKIIKTR